MRGPFPQLWLVVPTQLIRCDSEAMDAALRIAETCAGRECTETVAASSVAVAQAEVLTTEAALQASSKLFELAGTRSTLSEYMLDRHWRDARAHTLHDPTRWKYHAIGNFHLNGTASPRHAWI